MSRAKKIRVFKPVSDFCGKTNIRTEVQRWVWVEGGGVICEHKNGQIWKSEYTLKELINGTEATETKHFLRS